VTAVPLHSATAVFAVIFFATSFGLAIIAKNKAEIDDIGIPAVIESRQIQDSEVPIIEGTDSVIDDVPEIPED
jgi:preprotein translocase subunit SecG